MSEASVTTRICRVCRMEKPFPEMVKNHKSKYGVATICRKCDSVAKNNWIVRNREKSEAYHAEYRAKNREEIYARNKQFRVKNPGWSREYYLRTRERSAARERANIEINRALRQKRYKQDPEKYLAMGRVKARVRRVRMRSGVGSHTLADELSLWDRQGHKCAVPGCLHPISGSGKNRYNVDHIEPIARGGSNNPDNLQILCKVHNLEKRARDPYQWAQTHGMLFI